MKQNLLNLSLPRMASLVAVLLSSLQSLTAQVSPVGPVWDVVISGDQKGVAQLVFNPDHTIQGTEVFTMKPHGIPPEDPRTLLSGGIRVNGADTNLISTNTYFYGASELVGRWSLDSKGRILGTLLEGDDDIINGISFSGKRKGQRLTLVGRHEKRVIQYTGRLQAPLPDISGDFVSYGYRDGKPTVELYSLTPDNLSAFPNQYVVTGSGPDYLIMGTALLSGQNHLAIANMQRYDQRDLMSAVSGSFNPTKKRGSLTGVDTNHRRVTSKVEVQLE